MPWSYLQLFYLFCFVFVLFLVWVCTSLIDLASLLSEVFVVVVLFVCCYCFVFVLKKCNKNPQLNLFLSTIVIIVETKKRSC